MPDEKVSMIGAIIRALRGGGRPQESAQEPVEGTMAATPEAEAMSKRLPAAVMPRSAIEKKRARLKQLDEDTR